MLTLILSAAVAASSPVCAKLEKQLESHERMWANIHQSNRQMISLFFNADDQERYNQYRGIAANDDRDLADKADRIVTLILANKCKAPDHVPSWTTYPP